MKETKTNGNGQATVKTPIVPPFRPETIEQLSARFDAAIVDVLDQPNDMRFLQPSHIFDFDDGYRLHVYRDRDEEKEVIMVVGVRLAGDIMPPTLMIPRIAINFAAITDNKYGDAEVKNFSERLCSLMYVLSKT